MALVIKAERIQEELKQHLELDEKLFEAGYCMALAGLAFWKTRYYFIGLTDRAILLDQVTTTQKVVITERIDLSAITDMAVSDSENMPGARDLEFSLKDGRKFLLTFNVILGMHNPNCARNIAVSLYEDTQAGKYSIRFPGSN